MTKTQIKKIEKLAKTIGAFSPEEMNLLADSILTETSRRLHGIMSASDGLLDVITEPKFPENLAYAEAYFGVSETPTDAEYRKRLIAAIEGEGVEEVTEMTEEQHEDVIRNLHPMNGGTIFSSASPIDKLRMGLRDNYSPKGTIKPEPPQ